MLHVTGNRPRRTPRDQVITRATGADIASGRAEAGADQRNPEALKQRVLNAVSHWIGVARAAYPAKTIREPAVLFNLRGKVAGTSNERRPELRINTDLLGRYPVEMIQQTVPHEVAHWVCCEVFGPGCGHGPKWKQVMAVFGKPATRCHSMAAESARKSRKYIYACRCDEHALGAVRHKRVKAGSAYRCRKCRAVLTFTGQSRVC